MHKTRIGTLSLSAWLTGVLLLLPLPAKADETAALRGCRVLTDATQRLNCYDALPDSPSPAENPGAAAGAEDQPALDRRLQKENDLARRAFAVIPHRPNYAVYSYSSTPNNAPFQAIDPFADLQYQELKFQISLRVPVWNRMLLGNGDLWFGYTQLSFWQAFNQAQSSPFRETNYEPELGLSFRTDFPLLGLHHRLFSLGVVHQSNGRSDPVSRSWNRIWTSFELERGNFVLTLKPWYRIPENAGSDNNPDILDYVGRTELRAAWKYADQVLSVTARNNLQTRDNRGGTEFDWSFPVSKRFKGLIQYFTGYGESLIDYNVRMRRIGFGVLVEDWL
jgi:phospholipase A1